MPSIFYSLAIEYDNFQTLPDGIDRYDVERLFTGITHLRALLERTYHDAMVLGECAPCREALGSYWDRHLRAVSDQPTPPGQIVRGSWLVRLCMDMYEGDIPGVEGVCDVCVRRHWWFVELTQLTLVSKIPEYFCLEG